MTIVNLPDLWAYFPEFTLLVGTLVVFLMDIAGVRRRALLGGASTLFLAFALLQVLGDLRTYPLAGLATATATSAPPLVPGPILFSMLGFIFQAVFLGIALLVSFASLSDPEGDGTPTFYSLLLLATLGMLLVAIANDLILLLLAVEITGISTYVLVGYTRKDRRSLEAAMKFYIIGALSTTISFFGASLLFGAYGTTNLSALAAPGGPTDPSLALVGFAMLAVGLGFKVTAVPFHMWAVDVYDGAPSTVSAYLSAGSKKMGLFAMFAVFLAAERILASGEGYALYLILGGLAIATMTVGNVLALEQKTMKRMLAYSSISQAGYMLIGIAVGTAPALSGATLQIAANVLMKGGAFIVVAAATAAGIGPLITDYKGMGHTRPLLAMSFAIMLFSMAGIPLTLGFVGKFYLFFSAIMAGGFFTVLAVAGLLNSALSVFYYARVLKIMYMPEGEGPADRYGRGHSLSTSNLGSANSPGPSVSTKALTVLQEVGGCGAARMVVVVGCAVLLIGLGIYPTPLLNAMNTAAHQFLALH